MSLTLALGFLLQTPSAQAAPPPIQQPPASTITADRLPTVQMNGVAWSQVVIGNTVYVGGKFTQARPAGAAPGTNQTPRSNILAYDITTGNLITGFTASVDAQVLSLAASPDGTRIYAAGDFTTANGVARRRVAAFNATTGALVTAFNPTGVNSQARAVIATANTVYVGGGFLGLGDGTLRNNLAAFSASTGAVLPWNPNADYTVWALALSPDGSTVYAGGSFANVGGQPAYGLAKINGSGTGALDPAWTPAVRNAGEDAGITSLRVQGSFLYGTSYHFGPGGNLEGTFKVPLTSSDVVWVTDCHGDNYSSYLLDGIVYTASHAHYCGNMGDGFPQYSAWRFQHAQAWSDTVTGEILNDVHGYPNWHGVEPGPAMINWLPEMGIGSFTGQYQAGWSVDGNANYVVYGGEFPTVNGAAQQGLVRFGKRPVAPAKEGPLFVNGSIVPTLVPTSSTTLRVSWPTGFDRDSRNLTYKVIRNSAFGSPRYTTTAGSNWWTLPLLGYVETGLSPGASYSYQLVINDSDGNTVYGAPVSVTMPSSFLVPSAYTQAVRSAGARIYWPLNETSGTSVIDRAASGSSGPNIGVTDGRAANGVTWGQPGAIPGDTAAALGNDQFSRIFAGNCAAAAGCNWGTETAPNTFTSQVWIKTTSVRGGRILGFGDLQEGGSGHRDRHLYMSNSGQLYFGVEDTAGVPRTVSSTASFNDGQWHLVTATLSSAGMRLYVDAAQVGSSTTTTEGESYLGYWRVGADQLAGWPANPTTVNFTGVVDEVAIYPTALTLAQIQAIYAARAGGANQPPTADFTATTDGLSVAVDASASTDSDGTIASYAWNFGDGSTATGVTAGHPYAASGTYSVKLTVTDDDGATATVTKSVIVVAPGVVANDAFERSVTDGWGSADVGGAWTVAAPTTNYRVATGSGRMLMTAGSGPSAYLNSVSARDVDLRTALRFDKAATGGGIYTSVLARKIGTSDYRAKLRFTPTGTTLYLARTVNNTETILATQVLAGPAMAPADVLNVRLQVQGNGTTTVRAKVWRTGDPEPAGWTGTATDSTAALQNPGGLGFYSYMSGSATNSPVELSVPDLSVQNP